jgi:murein DD-endopeptidase MepM/ murein hydrolase activator NlpD
MSLPLTALLAFAVLGAVAAAQTPTAHPRNPRKTFRGSRSRPARSCAGPATATRGAARWPGRSWKALDGACYYPIDVLHKPAAVAVTRSNGKRTATARIVVAESSYGSEDVQLPDIPQAHPTPEDEARNAREQERVAAIWRRKAGPARFSLPLGNPAKQLPEGKTSAGPAPSTACPRTSRTWGRLRDSRGDADLAAADGTVALAEELFYPGNGVIVDHGDSLFTIYYHLSEIQVQAGQEVKKGERLGLAGQTGRATGPHLFFAVRWRNARIDPQFVLVDVDKLPSPE